MMVFEEKELEKIYKPQDIGKGGNGQVAIIGGSALFHGAPMLSLRMASRIVDMVFFSSPEPSVGRVAEQFKSQLNSFIWVPFDQIEEYLEKSDAILIGPGLMRYHRKISNFELPASRDSFGMPISNRLDRAGLETKKITERLLSKFPQKQWVIDAGSLHVMDKKFIPPQAILTPNRGEYEALFGNQKPADVAKNNNCIIVFKNAVTEIFSETDVKLVKGGNNGLVKGGTGDVLAGLSVALAAKNPPFWSACAASFIVKKAADELYEKVGFAYTADDLAEKIPEVLRKYLR